MVDATLDYLDELRFHLRELLRNGYFVQLAILPPAVFVVIRLLANADPAMVWADGVAAGIWTTSVASVGIVGFQRAQGTLEHLAASPRPLAWVLTPLAVSCTILGGIAVPVSALVIVVAGRFVVPASIPMFLAGVVLILVACSTSALCLSGLFVVTRHAVVYEPVIVAPILLLSGAVVPLSSLGQPWQSFSLLTPLTGAVSVLHSAVEGSYSDIWLWLFQFAASSALLLALGRAVLRLASHRSRRAGTLQLS